MTNEERIKSLCTGDLADRFFKIITECSYCPIEDLCNKQRIKNGRVDCKNVWMTWPKSEGKQK